MEAANDGDAVRRHQAGDPNLNVQNVRENMADLPADAAPQKAEFAFQPANFNNNSLVRGAAQEQEMPPLNEAAEMSIVNGNNATQACFAEPNRISREVLGSATNYVTEIEGENLQAIPFPPGDNSVAEELNPVADANLLHQESTPTEDEAKQTSGQAQKDPLQVQVPMNPNGNAITPELLIADMTDSMDIQHQKGACEGLYVTFDLDEKSAQHKEKPTTKCKDPKYLYDFGSRSPPINYLPFKIKCQECKQPIMVRIKYLSWGTNKFCRELCVFRYQKRIGLNCTKCGVLVPHACLAKFCVRFGWDQQQFCGANCLGEYKKTLQLCSCCQSNLTRSPNVMDSMGQIKRYCVECQNKDKGRDSPNRAGSTCSICRTEKPITIAFGSKLFCSELCCDGFKFTHKVAADNCQTCQKLFDARDLANNAIFYEDAFYKFCSQSCQNLYIINNSRILQCDWCKVKKYNFDMIQYHLSRGPIVIICSLSCLGYYQISVADKVNCGNCNKTRGALYHLTMSDGTIRSFCSSSCAVTCQNQFSSRLVLSLDAPQTSDPVTVDPPKLPQPFSKNQKSVVMLDMEQKTPTRVVLNPTTFFVQKPVLKIIIKRAQVPLRKNISTMCKVATHDISVGTEKPDTVDQSVQTDEIRPTIVPIPIPETLLRYPEIQRNMQVVPINTVETEMLLMAQIQAEDGPIIWTSNDEPTEPADATPSAVETALEDEERKTIRGGKRLKDSPTKRFPGESSVSPDRNMRLKITHCVNCWERWIAQKNSEFSVRPAKTDLLELGPYELNRMLCMFITEVRKPNGEPFAPDVIYYLCLGIQLYLNLNKRIDNLFCDFYYEAFTERLDEIVHSFRDTCSSSYVVTRIEEEHLWESKQLGVHSPQVLLNTLIFFNTKYFNLRTIADHKVLAFNNIIKHRSGKRDSGSKPKGMLLRLHANRGVNSMGARKIYEQLENIRDPFRCPVKMYEFYLSKCPDSVKSRSDVFYLQPERYWTPDSPVWYSSTPLGESVLAKTLNRARMVKEINVAFLNDLSGQVA